jgi:hypothetical protein
VRAAEFEPAPGAQQRVLGGLRGEAEEVFGLTQVHPVAAVAVAEHQGSAQGEQPRRQPGVVRRGLHAAVPQDPYGFVREPAAVGQPRAPQQGVAPLLYQVAVVVLVTRYPPARRLEQGRRRHQFLRPPARLVPPDP